jgi:chorismate-pyruvate lyase
MSALDIFEKLRDVDVGALEPLQRIFLITDGTLTEILEAAFFERIQLIKLEQNIAPASALPDAGDFEGVERLLRRKILLRGAASGRNYAYAESLIAVDQLGPTFRDELLGSSTPLGRLWLEHKLETFKELREIRAQPAGALAAHFGCQAAAALLMRRYRVFSAAKPVMTIAEWFPLSYYDSGLKTLECSPSSSNITK